MSSVLAPLPPYAQLRDFLTCVEHDALLQWALDHAEAFQPATITSGKPGAERRIDRAERISLTTRDLGGLGRKLKPRLAEALGQVTQMTGYSGPAPTSIELEIAAHGDGAHYRPHLDIPIGKDRAPLGAAPGEDRVISAVYYFYRQPKAFSGGELRLHRVGSDWDRDDAESSSYVDVEPVDNSLVAFPSWVMHEVRPVRCPSGRFEDYRFAINCWYCRPTSSAG